MMIRASVATALLSTAAVLTVLTVGGCAGSTVDREYGKATHQMVRAQVYRPETLSQRSDAPVEGVDPDSAKAAVDAMRKDTAERAHTSQPIIFTYGGACGGSQ
jgi:hypothetical protein